MNNRGQAIGSAILLVFIAVIVGIALFQSSAQNVGTVTNTYTVNLSKTLANAGSSIYVTNYRAITGVTIVNATDQSDTVPAASYTVTNNVVYNGGLSTQIATVNGTWNSSAVYVQGTGQPTTYSDNAGVRSMATLIVIFFALGIAVIALYPVFRERFM